MSDRVVNAVLSIALGLFLAAALFVPFAILNYRRRGRLTLGRTLVWTAGLVYGLALWTFTLVPFPEPGEIDCQSYNIHPLAVFRRILASNEGGWAGLFHNFAFLESAYNVLLFVPLGFILRLLWKRGWLFTTLVGACLTLFIETTQLTGVWGIYPCAYRYFDVDDLLANTTGALIGGVLSYPVARLLTPSEPARAVTVLTKGRRLVGVLADFIVAGFISLGAGIALQFGRRLLGLPYFDLAHPLPQAALALVPFLALGVFTLAAGRTPGDWAVLIRWPKQTLGARLVRYLAGIGGYTVLTPWPAFQSLFALAVILAVVFTRDHRGLPGLLTRQTPEIAAPASPLGESEPPDNRVLAEAGGRLGR